MSSATSTDRAGQRDIVGVTNNQQPRPANNQGPTADSQQLQPWQFFVLAALGCATAATFMARGRGITAVIMLSMLMAGAAMIGLAALRAFRPLVSQDEDRAALLDRRARAALEHDKLLALRAIKELEFDRAMGKLSDEDFKEMSGRLRAKAARLVRQLDAGAGYRDQIERDLARKLADRDVRSAKASAERVCASCSAPNDDDARFCKNCGAKL
jgi:zinc ribbon protein